MIILPVLVAFVALNTAMLTKFFESLIDEWLSFRWGIKISTVLGFFLSIIEIALGIVLYRVGRRQDSQSMMPALLKLLVIGLIGLLALIEMYLYYRLSYDMNMDRGQAVIKDSLPPWIHASWLAPFGPIIVISLAIMGHELISAINQFVDAGLQKGHEKTLDQMRRNWSSLTRSGSDLQRRIGEVKAACSEFIRGLRDADNPTAAVSRIQESLTRLSGAVEKAEKTRLSPYAAANDAEGRRIFATLTGLAVSLAVVIVVFCWIQLLYGDSGEGVLLQPTVVIAGAIAQAAAVLIASYKMYPPVALVFEGNPAEVLQGAKETSVSVLGILCLLAVMFYNLALAGAFRSETFQWIPFALALVCIGVLSLMGRTLPAIFATIKLWLKVFVATLVAGSIWAAALACWVLRLFLMTVATVLYVFAYPFFLVFWRKKLESQEEASVAS